MHSWPFQLNRRASPLLTHSLVLFVLSEAVVRDTLSGDLSGWLLLWSQCAMQGTWPKAGDSRRPAGSGHATRGQQGLWDGPALALKVGLGEPVKVAPAPDVGSH